MTHFGNIVAKMEVFVKKKIAEKLARFTTNLTPADISISFLSGKGGLRNVELDVEIFTSILQVPSWMRVTQVVCDYVTAKVPFATLKKDPLHFSMGQVKIEIETCEPDYEETGCQGCQDGSSQTQPESNASFKYGFTDKVIDGIRVDVRSIVIQFRDLAFQSRLEVSNVVIQSTTPQWQPASLPQTRYKNREEGYVIVYKMCSWDSMKLEGWSIRDSEVDSSFQPSQLKVIAGESSIRVARKRRIANCSIMCTKVRMHFGYIISVLSHSQLKEASRFVQSLLEAASTSAQTTRRNMDKASRSRVSSSPEILEQIKTQLEGVSHKLQGLKKHLTSAPAHLAKTVGKLGKLSQPRKASAQRDTPSKTNINSGTQKESQLQTPKKKTRSQHKSTPEPPKEKARSQLDSKLPSTVNKACSQPDSEHPSSKVKAFKERIAEYQDGKKELPTYEVIQDSFHLQIAIIDLQLCEDASSPDAEPSVGRSLQVQVHNLETDYYLEQPAGCGRYHWNKTNDHMHQNALWSRKQLVNSAKLHHSGPAFISTQLLREKGIVVRCSHFSLDTLKSGNPEKEMPSRPLVSCNMEALDMPDVVQNPGVQVGITLYFYPKEHGNKFLVPRPNLSIYVSPILINLDQTSCLWLVEYVHGVIQTVDLSGIGESSPPPDPEQSHQIPGIDMKFRIRQAKVTTPLPDASEDGCPLAVELDTGAISLDNRDLGALLSSHSFTSALQGLREGWIFSTQGTNSFPHMKEDGTCLLEWLFKAKLATGKPTQEESSVLEGWHLHISAAQLAFQESRSSETAFVKKFPIHVWVFPPHANTPPSYPATPIPATQLATKRQPFVFVLHTPKPLRAELERLQLLFLVKLKDSFVLFKDSFLRMLTHELTVSRPERSEGPPLNPVQNGLHFENESTQATSYGCALPSPSRDPPVPEGASFSISSAPGSSMLSKSAMPEPVKVVGYMVVGSAELNILLPSVHTGQSKMHSTLRLPSESVFTESSLIPCTEGVSEAGQTTLTQYTQGTVASALAAFNERLISLKPVFPSTPCADAESGLPSVYRHLSESNLHDHGGKTANAVSLSAPEIHTFTNKASQSLGSIPEVVRSSTPVNFEEEYSASQMHCKSFTTVQPGTSPAQRRGALSPPASHNTQCNGYYHSSTTRQNKPATALGRHTSQHVLRIHAEQFCALSSIQGSDISVKVSISTVALDEIESSNYTRIGDGQSSKISRKGESVKQSQLRPVLRGRLEVGEQASRFFSTSSNTDRVMLLKLDGLQVSLLLPTITSLVRFFKDESEQKSTVEMPIQLRVENTRVTVREASKDAFGIEIKHIEMDRGQKMEIANLFSDEVRHEREGEIRIEVGQDKPIQEGRGSEFVGTISSTSLLDGTFHSYEAHGLQQEDSPFNPQPLKVIALLSVVRSFLPHEQVLLSTKPSYSEAISSPSPCLSRSTPQQHTPVAMSSSGALTVQQLQKENQQLREDKLQISLELIKCKEELARVISECATIREELEELKHS